jgi:hypothetical protein
VAGVSGAGSAFSPGGGLFAGGGATGFFSAQPNIETLIAAAITKLINFFITSSNWCQTRSFAYSSFPRRRSACVNAGAPEKPIRRSSLAKIECGQFIVSRTPREADKGQNGHLNCFVFGRLAARPAAPLPLIPAMPRLASGVENN